MHPKTDDSTAIETAVETVAPDPLPSDLGNFTQDNPWYASVLIAAIGALLYKAIPAVWATLFKTSTKDSERLDEILRWQREYLEKVSDAIELQSKSLDKLANLQSETLSKVASVQEAIIRIFAELPRDNDRKS